MLVLLGTQRAGLLGSIHRGSQRSVGAVLFPFSLSLCALLYWPFDPLIFQGTALILGLADGLAGLVGERFGRRPYRLTGPKSLEGSLTFFGMTALALILLLSPARPSSWLAIFLASLLLTFTEALFSHGWDNLAVPLVTGGAMLAILSL